MNYSQEEKEYFMNQALAEAQKSLDKEEIPIGCVIVKDGQIIGRGHNAREELNQAIMHAEVMAIQEANRVEGNWRLLDTTLFVTIEPCVMCSGAIGLARIPQVVYGAANQKFGAAGSLYDILTDQRLNHRVEVETGILEEACAQIMQDFFRQRRERQKAEKKALKAQEEAASDS
ncbi:TPA: tRNA adenosine(34) deaminase TadA [Streptococcus suis]|nr:tRNA adenosine(34) deaminase TadA [Streptococcus suis]